MRFAGKPACQVYALCCRSFRQLQLVSPDISKSRRNGERAKAPPLATGSHDPEHLSLFWRLNCSRPNSDQYRLGDLCLEIAGILQTIRLYRNSFAAFSTLANPSPQSAAALAGRGVGVARRVGASCVLKLQLLEQGQDREHLPRSQRMSAESRTKIPNAGRF
jgi:hypothetical protein